MSAATCPRCGATGPFLQFPAFGYASVCGKCGHGGPAPLPLPEAQRREAVSEAVAANAPTLCAELLGETDEQTRALVKAFGLGLEFGVQEAVKAASDERLEILRLLGRAGGALNGIIVARRVLGESPMPMIEKVAADVQAFLTARKTP